MLLWTNRHVCCSCTRPPGTSVTIKLNQHACLCELHLPTVWISCNWLTSTYEVVWLNQQVYMLHLPQTHSYVLCSFPTNKLVSTIAPDHHACILQLHLTKSHVFISCILSACMSVTVSSYQGPCIFHLHRIISHVCNNYIWQIPMPLTFASNQQWYV